MFSKRPSEIRQWFKVAPQGFLTARGLGANIARALKVSTCKHGNSIRSHDCYLKRYNKNSLTQYNFYVMESRVSSNCTRNIHRPSTSEREVNQKGKHRERLPKGNRIESLRMFRYRSWRSSILLRNALRQRR